MMRPSEHGDHVANLSSLSPRETGSEPLTAIARFGNAAEAGFFAHELKLQQNIPVLLRAEEDFDAVAGNWSTRFVLSVPQLWAEPATLTLQELIAKTESEDYLSELPVAGLDHEPRMAKESQPFDPFADQSRFGEYQAVHWVPIVMTLAAGSLAIWGLKKVLEPNRPQPAANAPRDTLWEVLMTPSGRKWIQQDPGGKELRELEIDEAGNEAILREDRNGDQIFESTRRVKRN